VDTLTQIFSFMLHIDQQMQGLIAQYGVYIYAILFFVIFGETGFVVFPFLPGDSLLFIAGAFAADGSMNPWVLTFLLIGAAVLGNTVNYWLGYFLGKNVYENGNRFISRDTLVKTHNFYEKHGGKAIVMARFVPLFRTFMPFVAGVTEMNSFKFQKFNVLGAVVWVGLLVWGGYFFGSAQFTVFGKDIIVKDYLSTIAIVGFAAAFVPAVFGFAWQLLRRNKTKQ
jgi:membrane-associated protein